MRRAGIAVFCAAVSCEAFHLPIVTTSGWLSATRQQRACQTPAECHRRPRTAVGMTAADGTAAQKETKVAVTASSGAAAVDKGAAGDAVKAEGDPAVTTDVVEKKKGGRGSKQKKVRNYTPEEKEYLKKMADAPTIYKRIADEEFYPSVGYDGAFPSLEESLSVKYTGDSTFVNEEGKEEILMRVIIVGGGEEEGQFAKNLSEKGSGTLVDGLYVLWDPKEGELSDTVQAVKNMNVHDLGPAKMRDPEKVAQHARFMAANMLVAVTGQSSYGDDYVPRLKTAALEKGLTFVGPGLAAEVAKGDMAAFTKLVEATREALEP